jgi:hypothetical protein
MGVVNFRLLACHVWSIWAIIAQAVGGKGAPRVIATVRIVRKL